MLGGEAIRHDEPLVELRRQGSVPHLRHSPRWKPTASALSVVNEYGREHGSRRAHSRTLVAAPSVSRRARAARHTDGMDFWIAAGSRRGHSSDTRVLHRRAAVAKNWANKLAAEDPGPEVLDAACFERSSPATGVERVEQRLERVGRMLPYPEELVPTTIRLSAQTRCGSLKRSDMA